MCQYVIVFSVREFGVWIRLIIRKYIWVFFFFLLMYMVEQYGIFLDLELGFRVLSCVKVI